MNRQNKMKMDKAVALAACSIESIVETFQEVVNCAIWKEQDKLDRFPDSLKYTAAYNNILWNIDALEQMRDNAGQFLCRKAHIPMKNEPEGEVDELINF